MGRRVGNAIGYSGFHQLDDNLSIHHVTGIGEVVVITFGGEPFGVVAPTTTGITLVWADRPELGPLEVLRALERNGRMSSIELCEYLRLRPRVLGCHLRTLDGWGRIDLVDEVTNRGRAVGIYEARA